MNTYIETNGKKTYNIQKHSWMLNTSCKQNSKSVTLIMHKRKWKQHEKKQMDKDTKKLNELIEKRKKLDTKIETLQTKTKSETL